MFFKGLRTTFKKLFGDLGGPPKAVKRPINVPDS